MSEFESVVGKATEAPWWVKAPAYLAISIVGVPSLIALGAGYFIVQGVNHDIKVLSQYNLSELTTLSQLDNDQKSRWEAVRRLLLMQVATNMRICVHEARTKEEINDCLSTGESAAAPLGRKE